MTTLFNHHVPHDYFSKNNVFKVKKAVELVLAPSFDKPYTVDENSIYRILHRVLEERLECEDRMLQRAVMYIVSEIKQFELERNKHLNWENKYKFSQMPYNVLDKIGPPLHGIKHSRQPSTVRFYFSNWYTPAG